MKKVLVVAAHPDDETLGAGGVIAKHITLGDSVSVLILGEGVASRKEHGEDYSKEREALRADANRALAKLGVTDVSFLDFSDNSFDVVPLLKIIKAVERAIAEKRPDIVYTHHWGDLNVDHRITFDAVLTACRPLGNTVKKILCFEVPSSTEWNAQTVENAFMPNAFVDITEVLEKKISALKEYKSEMRPYPHPRSLEGIEILAKMRGLAIGRKAAEAFEIVREID